jgi:hypothetical protein
MLMHTLQWLLKLEQSYLWLRNSSGTMPKYWLEIITHALMRPDNAIAQRLSYHMQDLGTEGEDASVPPSAQRSEVWRVV